MVLQSGTKSMDAATSTTDAAMFMGANLFGATASSTSGPVGLLAAEAAANGRGVESTLMAAAELEAALLGQGCADGLRPLMILPSAIGL
jgi:hypothetical protein